MVVYVPLPLVAVITWVNAAVPVHVECDGVYSFTVILPTPVPLVTGFTSPDRLTLSLRVVEPTVALAGCGEVEMPGECSVAVTVACAVSL